MNKEKQKVPDGQVSREVLAGKDVILVWVLSVLNPIITGAILYYGWRKKLPVKAKKANHITLWVFLIEVIVGLTLGFLSARYK